MTYRARRELFDPKLQHFLSFSVYLNTTQAKQIINLLLLNNFYPSKSDELLYTVRSLVTVRETSCQRKGVKNGKRR